VQKGEFMKKRILAILILLCLCLALVTGCNKQAVVENPTPKFTGEPTPTPPYSTEGFVEETKYELVEPQSEPTTKIENITGFDYSIEELFMSSSYLVYGKIIDMQELKIYSKYAETDDFDSRPTYRTIITLEVVKNYGESDLPKIENNTIKYIIGASSVIKPIVLFPKIGDDCFAFLIEVENSIYNGYYNDIEDYCDYAVPAGAICNILGNNGKYEAGYLQRLKTHEELLQYDEQGKLIEPEPYTFEEVEAMIAPYLELMQGLVEYEIKLLREQN
jgi:hypothetical protein